MVCALLISEAGCSKKVTTLSCTGFGQSHSLVFGQGAAGPGFPAAAGGCAKGLTGWDKFYIKDGPRDHCF